MWLMPWKEIEAMDQRIEFAMKAMSSSDFAGLCREYGISRKTGYKWRERFLSHGISGMAEQSRKPLSHAHELPEAIVCEMVRLKQAHPHWGPRKIRELYRRAHRGCEPPSESSFKRVLERAGLTQERKRRVAQQSGRLATGIKAAAANEVGSVDFKISTSLAGWDVGLGERESDQVELWFANLLLGHVHLNTLSFKATQPPKSRVAGGGRDRWFGCFHSAPRAKNQERYSHVRPNSPKRKHPR
jgi:transposase-like protein